MAIVTTYVCDVTGKNGTDRYDFVEIDINATQQFNKSGYWSNNKVNVKKLVHIDVARNLNLVQVVGDEVTKPEVTFESKLATLLKDYVEEIAYEAGSEGASNYILHRG